MIAFASTRAEKRGHHGVAYCLLILEAILLPPLAVYVVKGLGNEFLVNLVLTLLAWIPGIIHALFIVTNSERVPTTSGAIPLEENSAME